MARWRMVRMAILMAFVSVSLTSLHEVAYAEASASKASASKAPALRIVCQTGTKVQGGPDDWTPISKCQPGSAVVGLQRIDLLKHSTKDVLVSVNDFICDAKGCRAWCQNSACTVEARCCHVQMTED